MYSLKLTFCHFSAALTARKRAGLGVLLSEWMFSNRWGVGANRMYCSGCKCLEDTAGCCKTHLWLEFKCPFLEFKSSFCCTLSRNSFCSLAVRKSIQLFSPSSLFLYMKEEQTPPLQKKKTFWRWLLIHNFPLRTYCAYTCLCISVPPW